MRKPRKCKGWKRWELSWRRKSCANNKPLMMSSRRWLESRLLPRRRLSRHYLDRDSIRRNWLLRLYLLVISLSSLLRLLRRKSRLGHPLASHLLLKQVVVKFKTRLIWIPNRRWYSQPKRRSNRTLMNRNKRKPFLSLRLSNLSKSRLYVRKLRNKHWLLPKIVMIMRKAIELKTNLERIFI